MSAPNTRIGVPWVLASSLLIACGTAGSNAPKPASPAPARQVPQDAEVDLSGGWTDADGQRAVQALVKDLLASEVMVGFSAKQGRKPVLRLYPVRNRTSDHINIKHLANDLTRRLSTSGKVRLKASITEAMDARQERAAGGGAPAAELATDFVLNGWITAEEQRSAGELRRAYTLTLKLTGVQNTELVWTGAFKNEHVVKLTRGAKIW